MRILLLIGLVVALGLMPFVWLKRPWALRVWYRLRLVIVIYVLVVFIAAVVRLATGWDDIYG